MFELNLKICRRNPAIEKVKVIKIELNGIFAFVLFIVALVLFVRNFLSPNARNHETQIRLHTDIEKEDKVNSTLLKLSIITNLFDLMAVKPFRAFWVFPSTRVLVTK